MISYLLTACAICERNGIVGALRNVRFEGGRIQAFNGLLQYQAPSTIDAAESFMVSHERLATALRACGDEVSIDSTKDFLRLKHGPFKVRVRKLAQEESGLPRISIPKSAQQQKAGDLLQALRRVQPFISTDASRAWSVAALVKDGYVWATNNLALVRTPVEMKTTMKIPSTAVDFLCSLPSLDYWHVDEHSNLIFVSGKQLIRCPQASADWPDVEAFLKKMPKKMPEIPAPMREAAQTVGRFADRHVGLDSSKVESKTQSMETEYEIDFEKSAGVYNAKLLALILEHATHADFSFYPEPIFFRGEALEGTAVGVKQV
jgi:hypothetical protein